MTETTKVGIARIREGYVFAFDVGLIGSIILALIGLVGPLPIVLIALWVWFLITLFVLPRLYVYFTTRGVSFSQWRGPHQ